VPLNQQHGFVLSQNGVQLDREVAHKMNEGIFIALRQTVLASGSRTLKNQNAQRNAARDPASARN
jgi:hypothetical protein